MNAIQAAEHPPTFRKRKHASTAAVKRSTIECHNTKTKVITLAKQKKAKYPEVPIRNQCENNRLKRGETWATKSRLALILYLIG